jgi:hypothetical protein
VKHEVEQRGDACISRRAALTGDPLGVPLAGLLL